ncbi:DUF397 domain-containing protein [Microbispora sp. H13382]|uniref:DUF397 domain-containing protein n=1 Tax=Microbispora sp. H13382 TaxID=2729112 RepID=UPI0016012BF9|nr:DUF397 domain-containing protein [Microbispora sp. H13382]
MESTKDSPTFPPEWRISSRCNGGSCVQVAFGDGVVAMRDSKDLTGPVLSFTSNQWRGFLDAVKAGNLDRP